MLGKLVMYNDAALTIPIHFDFGPVLAGEAKHIDVYAHNEGTTTLRDLKVILMRQDVEIIDGERDSLNPKDVWHFQLVWKPAENLEESFLDEEIKIVGFSFPVRRA